MLSCPLGEQSPLGLSGSPPFDLPSLPCSYSPPSSPLTDTHTYTQDTWLIASTALDTRASVGLQVEESG